MKAMEKAHEAMTRVEAFRQAIAAVESCKDDYFLPRNKERLEEELAKDASERDESQIDYLRSNIADSEKRNAVYEEIEEMLLKLMMGGSIK